MGQVELAESETETGAETGTGMDNQMDNQMGGAAALGQSLSHHLDVPVMGSIFE